MHKFGKLITALLAATMLVATIGCGNAAGPGNSTPKEPATEVSSTETSVSSTYTSVSDTDTVTSTNDSAVNDVAVDTTDATTDSATEIEPVPEAVPEPEVTVRPDVTIIYTNDIHSYINNTGTSKGLLDFSKVAARKQESIANGENVFLVDAGDHVQGTAYGLLDEGRGIISIMEAAGYDVSAVGNHEFDFGLTRALEIFENSGFPYISCNFIDTRTNEPALKGSIILESNGAKVAFVGITTPSIAHYTSSYFEDENGNKIYDFVGSGDGTDLYELVQKEIDALQGKADYIVAIGHCGTEEEKYNYKSTDIIANTTGLDAFIDGHSHSVIECESVLDKSGKTVILTQAGSDFSSFGVMKLTDGSVSSVLVTEYEVSDEATKQANDALVASVETQLKQSIAYINKKQIYKDPYNELSVKMYPTNSGEFMTDGIYWYFNEKLGIDCDVTFLNAGSISGAVKSGEYSYLTANKRQQKGDVMCVIEVDGKTLKDALEYGHAKGWESTSDKFLHVSGITCEVYVVPDCSLKTDKKGNYTGSATGEYRVKEIKIYNKEKNKYEPIDLNKTYKIAGSRSLLLECGYGYNMFENGELIVDYVIEDYLCEAEYAKAFKVGKKNLPVVSNSNSPLAKYKNYKFNYEEMYSSNRIVAYCK